MAYSAEVMQKARARLAAAREDRASENRQHLQIAYAQIPQLRELDIQIRSTMAKAAMAAFAKGEDGRQAMEAIRQENLALQQQRKELAEAHFPAGYLDDAPICDKCGGGGYIGSSMCSCLQELCRQEQKKELTLLSGGTERFDQFRLDYYPDREDPKFRVNIRSVMEKTLKTCIRYAEKFSLSSPNLLFFGDTGLGKTFLSACIARRVAEGGYSVVYDTASHLFSRLERAKFTGDENARREAGKYSACDLLIIDDLGTEMPGQFTTSALYSLVNDRILEGKPTIISTNLLSDEIPHRYNKQIASRLRGNFQQVPFLGEDIRVLKNRSF